MDHITSRKRPIVELEDDVPPQKRLRSASASINPTASDASTTTSEESSSAASDTESMSEVHYDSARDNGISSSYDSSSSSSAESESDSESETDSGEDDSDAGAHTPSPVEVHIPLKDRLAAFLPQLAAANAELEEARRLGTLDARRVEIDDNELSEEDDGGEGGGERGQYIEMNLGLGVLEEKRARTGPDGVILYNDSTSESSSSEDEEESAQDHKDGDKVQARAGSVTMDSTSRNVLDKLLKRKKLKQQPGIQVVPDD